MHIPGSPFKIKVGGDRPSGGRVQVLGRGLEQVKVGERSSFVIDTSEVGAGTLSVTVDGPSKVDMDCVEVDKGYYYYYYYYHYYYSPIGSSKNTPAHSPGPNLVSPIN